MKSSSKKLDPVRERRRRIYILIFVMPRLLNQHLRPLLGWQRFLARFTSAKKLLYKLAVPSRRHYTKYASGTGGFAHEAE